jgi:chaperonin cofactor prefoldin
VNSLKESVEKRELDVLESKIDTINTKFQSVSQNLYDESNATDEVSDSDFSDVEFDEVK